ncbi:MAG: 50S ribosomal protein L24 [Alphaproteobacteria bacterium]|nr:50S ribosomal protein L24 [Alphaproteobacteria bacterium]
MAWKLKKGDDVFVIAGDHKGSKGKISLVDRTKSRVIVEGVNIVSRHVKPSIQNPEGGVVKKEASIHISNVALVAPSAVESLQWSKKMTTKVGFRFESDVKVRCAKRDGSVLGVV